MIIEEYDLYLQREISAANLHYDTYLAKAKA